MVYRGGDFVIVRALILVWLATAPLLPATADDGTDFDRFFTTAAVRTQLNQAREQYTAIGPVNDEDEDTDQQTLFPEVKVKGMIVRSDGSSEIWLNGASTVGNDNISREIRTLTERVGGERVRVTLPDGKAVTLKPGQLYSPDDQRVLEIYQTSTPVQPEPVKDETAEAVEPVEDVDNGADKVEEFDESILAETHTRIKLLEERLEKLEQR